METRLHDFCGVNQLLRSPLFAVAAVVALTLGLGAHTAIFDVVNAVLLRPLAFNEPDHPVLASGVAEDNALRPDLCNPDVIEARPSSAHPIPGATRAFQRKQPGRQMKPFASSSVKRQQSVGTPGCRS